MRLLELTLLSLVASVVFAVTAGAAIPAQAPVVYLGPAATSVSATLDRPQRIALPERPVAAVRKPPAPAPHSVAALKRHRTVSPHRPRRIVSAPRPVAPHDSYPYRLSATNEHDTWGFTQRQCVSYVAWRLAETGHALSNDRDRWGSASNWEGTAQRLGIAVDQHPAVGAVAQWLAGESSTAWAGNATGTFTAGEHGHVGYVTQVFADGSVQVAQYNAIGDRSFSSMRMTAPRFLHL